MPTRNILLLGSMLLLSGCDATAAAKPSAGGPSGAMPVGVVSVARRDVPLVTESVAALDGYVNADIRARVHGYLRGQAYKDGATVKRGQPLFTIEQNEYAVAVESAKATLERATTAEAHTKIELDRDVALFKSGTLSQQDLDAARATHDDALAQVRSAHAALARAQIDLSYTTISSPIDGTAGLAQVRVGNLVGQNEPTLLTTVSQTDPMRVTFPISETEYVRHPDRFRDLDKRDLAWTRAALARLDRGEQDDGAVDLVLADGSVYGHRGVVVTVNRNIDATTGTLLVQALVSNPDGVLRPGEYARVRVPRSGEGTAVLLVPEKALVSVQGSYSVALVGDGDKIAMKKVELGPSVSGERVVKSGVREGDRVVVEGTQRVTDGAQVVPHAVAKP